MDRPWHGLAVLLTLGTLAAIAWFGLWTWPQGRSTPGFDAYIAAFCIVLAVPYLVVLWRMGRGDARAGLRWAAGTAAVNAAWWLPLAVLTRLFAGFTMGNRDQEQALLAITAGAALQPLLLGAALAGLRGLRRLAAPGGPLPGPLQSWAAALALPALLAGAALLSFRGALEHFERQSSMAAANTRFAQDTIARLQACLAPRREPGFPESLADCGDPSSQLHEHGYRLSYRPGVADEAGRRRAYLLCAEPLRYRASGVGTVIASSAGLLHAGVPPAAAPAEAAGCVSVAGLELSLAWCAFEFASNHSEAGYPRRLAELTACMGRRSDLRETGIDRISDAEGRISAYVADAPGPDGRVTGFRLYRLHGGAGQPMWLDDHLAAAERRWPHAGPIVEGLPAEAAPERFMPGCEQGRGADCHVAGLEWERRLRQGASGDSEATAATLRRNAVAAFERGCDLGDGRSCSALGRGLEYGEHGPRDVVRAARLFERACGLSDALGCRRAGEMFESGRKGHVPTLTAPSPPDPPPRDLARDLARSADLLERACILDDNEACFMAGRLCTGADGLVPDRPRALRLFERACDGAMAAACERAAALDPARQEAFQARACAFDLSARCAPPRSPAARSPR